MTTDLEGRTCVVTGAGRGIGRFLATELAARGADLVLCSRTGAELERTAGEIRVAGDVDVLARAVDVTDTRAVAELAADVGRRRPATALLNCAGVLGPVGRIDEVDLGRWREALEIDVFGTVVCCAAFAPQMIGAGRGSIVNLSGGGVGGPGLPGRISAYTTSKAAVVAFTETLAVELAPHGVRVNAIAPGPVATGFMREVLERGPGVAGSSLYETTVRQQEGAGATAGAPDRLLELIGFLVSDASAAITGRLLSARWETVEELGARAGEIARGSLFTMRRIDDDLYAEREPEPRP